MAPAPSKLSTTYRKSTFKASGSVAKKFLDRYSEVPKEVVVDLVGKTQRGWLGEMNKALMKAEKERLCLLISNCVMEEDGDERANLPIVGRGKGKDTTHKSFYRGNGEDVKVGGMINNGVAYYSCEVLYTEAFNQFEDKMDNKVSDWKKDNPGYVPTEVHTCKKMKTDGGIVITHALSIDDTSSAGAGVDGDWTPDQKAGLYTVLHPSSKASDEEKAALFDVEARNKFSKK